MDTRPSRRPAALDDWDELVREPLPTAPHAPLSAGRRLVLGALAALLVITIAGTTALVIRDLRLQASTSASTSPAVRATTPTVTPAALSPTATTAPLDPKANGWNQFTPVVYSGDVAFAPSNPQRGYLCGQGQQERLFAVTSDGGKTWQTSPSPAQYSACSLQVSAANPLALAVVSQDAGQSMSVDAHYSSDGGKTWKTVPFPQATQIPGGAVWSGTYLYLWAGPSTVYPQKNYLAMSANGGAFVSIDPSTLLPGAQGVAIEGAVATGDTLYLNLGYSCSALQSCQAIVASTDGGKTWPQIPNKVSIQLAYVMGNTLYGWTPDPQDANAQIEWTTSDNGATWTQLKLPPIPGVQGRTPAPLAIPAPDGTLFAAPDGLGIAYLRGGTWTVLPFSLYGEHIRLALVLDGSGKPAAVWAIDDGNDSYAGIYWHPLP